MSPIRDINTCIRATSDGATAGASTNSAVFEFDGTPMHGLALQLNLATGNTSTPTLSAYIHFSTSTSAPTTDSRIAGQRTGMALSLVAGQKAEYIIPFVAPDARALLVEFAIAGATPIITGLEAYLVLNVGKEWDRSVSFH